MAWTSPAYSKAQVDAAGRTLLDVSADWDQVDKALDVINNWRASHSFPLNTFTVTLKRKGSSVDPNCLVAQRIKRLASITHKLDRFPRMRLSQIQDIGGCRAVVSSIEQVRELVEVYRRSDLKHKPKIDDYLLQPQESGYRGMHLIYTYNSDRSEVYNGLKVEMQIRSQFQHAWATAVETVGTFIRQALKSSQGEAEWLRFFALMGTAIAHQENTAPVRNTPSDRGELRNEIAAYVDELDVIGRLEAFGQALQTIENPTGMKADYFLLELIPAAREVLVKGFARNRLGDAQLAYAAAERRVSEQGGSDVVLVSVDSVAALRRAYPNYFLDTRMFIELVRDAVQGQPMAPPPPLPAEAI
ncbi:MAG TPA: RelA/SpoT domain-containing protein [Phenylobacterium sp.]|uniref:RelA/SpoT domain-containing protein n=1 Tax=Phenylobacterium sp. TaxID=1871053 RepID=UPI002B45ED47|nr:RelA/SpoT domain-containing protein [Phenylobacterium sp.]HKR89595.1 RelA/SpoT domain-containing protein [Phenylobacterium sp.]